MIDAVRAFLALLESDLPREQRLPALARALDALAFVYHETAEGAPGESDPPPSDHGRLRQAAAERYPELGYYSAVAPIDGNLAPGDPTVSDAIDDLADIAGDLLQVAWLHENVSPAAASWQFRLGYRTHWGAHLHGLRAYLHALMSLE